jgi:hypothetical protein
MPPPEFACRATSVSLNGNIRWTRGGGLDMLGAVPYCIEPSGNPPALLVFSRTGDRIAQSEALMGSSGTLSFRAAGFQQGTVELEPTHHLPQSIRLVCEDACERGALVKVDVECVSRGVLKAYQLDHPAFAASHWCGAGQ